MHELELVAWVVVLFLVNFGLAYLVKFCSVRDEFDGGPDSRNVKAFASGSLFGIFGGLISAVWILGIVADMGWAMLFTVPVPWLVLFVYIVRGSELRPAAMFPWRRKRE